MSAVLASGVTGGLVVRHAWRFVLKQPVQQVTCVYRRLCRFSVGFTHGADGAAIRP